MNNNEINTNEQVNQPVEPQVPVQPVEQVTQTAPEVQVTQIPAEAPKKKGSNNVLLIVLLLIILLAGAGCAYYFLIVKQQKADSNSTTTTTTISNVNSNLLNIKTINDYFNYINEENIGIKPLDNTVYSLDYDYLSKCKNDGDTGNFTVNNSNVSYKCNIEVSEDQESPYYLVNVTVNDKYKYDFKWSSLYNTTDYNYTNDKYYLKLSVYMNSVGISEFTIENDNNDLLLKHDKADLIVMDDTAYDTPILLKDNILYFVDLNDYSDEDYSKDYTCSIKYIDLKSDTIEVKDMNVTTKCNLNY